MPKISIIIPVYNVEDYIERCLHSLFLQTLDDIEYIFVNDASPDSSIIILSEILNLYPNRKPQVKIIHHKQNLGVASARTSGIKSATGEYIIHCDPDDYIETDMYETLYTYAKSYNVSIVGCDFIKNANSQKLNNIRIYNNPKEILKTWFNSNKDYSSLCTNLVKRDLILKHKIYPFKGINYGEDFGSMIRIIYHADSYLYLDKGYYYYSKRDTSLSNNYSIKRVSQERLLVNNVSNFLWDSQYTIFLNNLKFIIKMRARHLYKDNLNDWFNLYKECHKHILKYKGNTLKARILWFIALSNFNIYKFLKRNLNVLN